MPGTWPPCRPGMWWRCTPGRLSRASWASARHRKSAPSATPVTIRHDDGTQAHSAHRKSGPFRVRTTEQVHAGPILAEAGNSGCPFGRHVHVHGTRDPRITAPRVPSFLRRRSAVHRGEDFGPGRRGPAPAVAGGKRAFLPGGRGWCRFGSAPGCPACGWAERTRSRSSGFTSCRRWAGGCGPRAARTGCGVRSRALGGCRHGRSGVARESDWSRKSHQSVHDGLQRLY